MLYAVVWKGIILRAFNDQEAAEEWVVDEQTVVPVVAVELDEWRELVAELLEHQRKAGKARKERIDTILLKVGATNA